MAIAATELDQPRPTVAPQWLEVVDPLRRQQALDAVHVLDALDDQPLALAVRPPRVFPLRRGHPHHVAGGAIAAPPGDQRPQQHRRVQPVGLGAPRLAVHLQAAGVHHPAADPLRGEAPLQPEPVVAGLVAEDDPHLTAAARLLLTGLQTAQQREEDRKSTRLNSSHANISYAVFCLKKKKHVTSGATETE